jgi:hypothetical protein
MDDRKRRTNMAAGANTSSAANAWIPSEYIIANPAYWAMDESTGETLRRKACKKPVCGLGRCTGDSGTNSYQA